MKRHISLIVVAILCSMSLCAARKALPKAYQYRLYLKDKNHSAYSLQHPEAFLSQQSIRRRSRQNLAIDSTDLPVSHFYVDKLRSLGLKIMGTSRWHNSVWVESASDDVVERVGGLGFVTGVTRLYVSPDSIDSPERDSVDCYGVVPDSLAKGKYGDGFRQIEILNGIPLHDNGFRGRGMTIAILDAGFHNADRIPALRNVPVVATADFAPRRSSDIYKEHYHGTMVLSTMAMNVPDTMIGTAPEARYVLIRTEDVATETPAEEDAWTMGAEFADSIGADVINSSLGYYHWDGDTTGLELRNLDGRTTFISQTASMLAEKGIILCNSAGNEGIGTWRKISVPSDADGILSVGAVDSKGSISLFSSVGPSQDGRMKPDVSAPGSSVYVLNGRGILTTSSGTSFASPILCGLVACLWQAKPMLTASDVIRLVRQSGDRSKWPDNVYGYGIPDFTSCLYPPVSFP